MSLRVYGLIMHENGGGTAHHARPNVPMGAQLMPVRELAAITEEGEYTARDAGPADVERHMEIVDALFKQDAVLPLPVGTVFRSAEVLQRWMELHYVALSDALAWVEDRAAARVHVTSAHTHNGAGERETTTEIAAIAAEVTKQLRRYAVATVPVRVHDDTGHVHTSASLVERPLWKQFTDAVQAETKRHHATKLTLSGPWPPYDFVRVQFGS
jgi:hypothetical protein